MHSHDSKKRDYAQLSDLIKVWAKETGFAEARIGRVEIDVAAVTRLNDWLAQGRHGEMDYLERHADLRAHPAKLVPGSLSVITVRMNYWPQNARDSQAVLDDGSAAYVARYALGRDYHKTLRQRLARLAAQIEREIGDYRYRVFTDSAPVMEVQLATQTGMGWRGKHTLLLTREQGSLFFLGEIFTDLPLPPDPAQAEGHCGRCTRCLDICPTQAIVAPFELDARRCISYLTIELRGSIPVELRPLIGNRVYGCDDCQLVCPWNRFAVTSPEPDFVVRNGLDDVGLIALFAWSEEAFTQRLAGSPIYRIGYPCWLRNLAVGLGNAPTSPEIIVALRARVDDASPLVREHVAWALAQHALHDML